MPLLQGFEGMMIQMRSIWELYAVSSHGCKTHLEGNHRNDAVCTRGRRGATKSHSQEPLYTPPVVVFAVNLVQI